jgi:hypothetical protein
MFPWAFLVHYQLLQAYVAPHSKILKINHTKECHKFFII